MEDTAYMEALEERIRSEVMYSFTEKWASLSVVKSVILVSPRNCTRLSAVVTRLEHMDRISFGSGIRFCGSKCGLGPDQSMASTSTISASDGGTWQKARY